MSQKAGTTGSIQWKSDPENMLKHRSDSKAARAAFPHVLNGIYIPDERFLADGTVYYAAIHEGILKTIEESSWHHLCHHFYTLVGKREFKPLAVNL